MTSTEPNETKTDRENDGQEYLDRDKLDFDPDEGLYSGTAVDGTTNIPGPHEHGDDVTDEDETGDPLEEQ